MVSDIAEVVVATEVQAPDASRSPAHEDVLTGVDEQLFGHVNRGFLGAANLEGHANLEKPCTLRNRRQFEELAWLRLMRRIRPLCSANAVNSGVAPRTCSRKAAWSTSLSGTGLSIGAWLDPGPNTARSILPPTMRTRSPCSSRFGSMVSRVVVMAQRNAQHQLATS